MVFFHGGNFKQGWSGGVLYDGTTLVNTTGVVLVTVNYRLGALGWAYTGKTINGSYGLRDQRAALAWVRMNIAAFGGDAGSVTVFGQSAGASSIGTHLVTPDSAPLFDRAIMQVRRLDAACSLLRVWRAHLLQAQVSLVCLFVCFWAASRGVGACPAPRGFADAK